MNSIIKKPWGTYQILEKGIDKINQKVFQS